MLTLKHYTVAVHDLDESVKNYETRFGMKAIGETGTGKTEAVVQFHAALNLPLFHVTANPRMEAYHLIGWLVAVGY